jgi:hypothetical protein
LEKLGHNPDFRTLVSREREKIFQAYEKIFDHQSFTGRSGTFYGYEGLGCIYWHMVSKLLLAVQEIFFRALEEKAPASVCRALSQAYYDIRKGLGDSKSPLQYGAFPMDPYSHTPARSGARQPGLTGQVKEDILCRWGELGVFVEKGVLTLRPDLLRKSEFSRAEGEFDYYDLHGNQRRLHLPMNSLGFTFCQTPFLYRLGHEESITVVGSGGSRRKYPGLVLDPVSSRFILRRTGRVERIEVGVSQARLSKLG